ncbi:hypothetical protein SADUNF_Sadunf03G0073700 [Salix dunnii]|uniref:NAC domain-containing protein n=1 Tax=Salix dunnii TaxID=1413687 RepID=A0A835K7K2_9ROSI|nr:hypothetical protein SADUNF_Sadunf03G0073700 [Salix dunnii]
MSAMETRKCTFSHLGTESTGMEVDLVELLTVDTGKMSHSNTGALLLDIGRRLDFYTGKALQVEKTNWKMHEFTVNDPAPKYQVRNTRDYMRLDDRVLCKIYKKIKKPNDVRNRQRDEESSTLSAIDDGDSVNHHGEGRTDLPVMDSGHAREIDNGGAGAVFSDDYSQQEIASSEFPADFNIHAASYSRMFPSLAETCGDPASVFSNSDNMSAQDELLNPAYFHWNIDDPFFDLHTILPINIPGNPVPVPGNLANPASPCNLSHS